ncbi:MAG: glycosyltransferase [Bacteroidota bacterium]
MSSVDPRTVLFYLDRLEMGGVERVTLNLLQGLKQSGWSPILALNTAKGELLGDVSPGIPIFDLQAQHLPGAVRSLHDALEESKAGILFSARAYLNTIAMLACIHTPAKLVLAEHTLLTKWWKDERMPKRRADQVIRLTLPLVSRMADAVVGVSQGVVQDLARACRLPPEKIHLCYNPILPAAIESMAQTALPFRSDRPVVLAIGRMSQEKGFDLLLEAFRRLETPAHLVLVGDGPELPRLRALAEGLSGNSANSENSKNSVTFAGTQRNPFPWIERSNVLALSSLIESFPTVLIEAMARGKPVVAFDCPVGPREIIRHEGNGLLVPPRDPAALARALDRVLSDSVLAARLGEAGRADAKAFGFGETVQAYEALFHSLFEKRGSHEHPRNHEPVDDGRSGAVRRSIVE